MKNSELVRSAAEYIMAHGHTRHMLLGDEGTVCVMGAFNAVLCGNPMSWKFLTLSQDDKDSIVSAMIAAIAATDLDPMYYWIADNLLFSANGSDHNTPWGSKEIGDPWSGFGSRQSQVVQWNNATCRTGEDVILMLKTAAGFLADIEEEEE